MDDKTGLLFFFYIFFGICASIITYVALDQMIFYERQYGVYIQKKYIPKMKIFGCIIAFFLSILGVFISLSYSSYFWDKIIKKDKNLRKMNYQIKIESSRIADIHRKRMLDKLQSEIESVMTKFDKKDYQYPTDSEVISSIEDNLRKFNVYKGIDYEVELVKNDKGENITANLTPNTEKMVTLIKMLNNLE